MFQGTIQRNPQSILETFTLTETLRLLNLNASDIQKAFKYLEGFHQVRFLYINLMVNDKYLKITKRDYAFFLLTLTGH